MYSSKNLRKLLQSSSGIETLAVIQVGMQGCREDEEQGRNLGCFPLSILLASDSQEVRASLELYAMFLYAICDKSL